MAYLRDIAHECDRSGCTRKATKRLYNARNAPCGDYCTTHARTALTDAMRREREHA